MQDASCDTDHIKPFVHETLTTKSLFFSVRDVQSQMHIERPDELQFEYTRLMMGFLLFHPRPRRLLMIGLGGGSLAKFCYRHFPETHITVVEINPHVIALRKDFGVPDDDERFVVVQEDASSFIKGVHQRFEVILADGFDVSGLPQNLSSARFYADCHQALKSDAVMVSNLHRCNRLFETHLSRMQRSFGVPLLAVEDPHSTNSIVFASKIASQWTNGLRGVRRPSSVGLDGWHNLVPSMGRVFLASCELTRQCKSKTHPALKNDFQWNSPFHKIQSNEVFNNH